MHHKRKTSSQPLHPRKKQNIEVPASALELKHEIAHQQYTREGFSQDVQLLLKRIISSERIPKDIRQQPLLRMLTEIAFQLQLNEIEISLWAIFLDQCAWIEKSDFLHWHLLFSAYAAKTTLNKDAIYIEYYLKQQYDKFQENYETWISSREISLRFDAKALNQKFSELSVPPSIESTETVNYNYYVDEILQNAPPSAINETMGKAQTLKPPEIRKTDIVSSPEVSSRFSQGSEEEDDNLSVFPDDNFSYEWMKGFSDDEI